MFREDRAWRVACDKVRISLIILDATALGAVLLITTDVMLIFVRPVRLIYYLRAVLYTTHIIVCMVVHLCHVTIAVCRRFTHFSVVLAYCSLLGWVIWGEGILSTLSVISRCCLVPFSRSSSNGEFAFFFPTRIGVAYDDDAPAVSADDRLPNGLKTGLL